MAISNPRNRVVVFRLTQEEYEALRSVSATRGARNLSDFGRSLLLGAIDGAEKAEALQQVCSALSGLQEVVGKMVERFDEVLHGVAVPGEGRNR